VRAARSEPDPVKMVEAFARILADLMERTSSILYVLASAAQVDPDAAGLLADVRRQRHTGQSRIVAALVERDALDPDLDPSKAADTVYAFMSPDVHRILTIERGWSTEDYEAYVVRCLRSLLSHELARARSAASGKGRREK
jgi:hypothetical protein